METKDASLPGSLNPTGETMTGLICPHWSVSGRHCLLARDGLFLPVARHIRDFCESEGHVRCARFRAYTRKSARATNRRRSARLAERHLFHFSEIYQTDLPTAHPGDEAWTLDLSDHGLRFATTCQLQPDMAIHFQLEGNGSPGREGTGRVVWCQPLADTAFFEAGVVLLDRSDTSARSSRRRNRRA